MKITFLFNLFRFINVSHIYKKRFSSRQYKNFNFWFIVAIFIPTFLVGTFNFLIDPYGTFNTPNLFGINHSKPKKDNNDRLFKALDIIRIKPVTIILGSSRTKQGINPNHPALVNVQPVYNLAINGPNAYEVLRYLQHAISNQKNIKEVILGIDFFMFNKTLKNQPSFSESRLETQFISPQDAINSLFSWDAISASQNTIIESLKESDRDPDYGENGFMPNRNVNKGITKWRFEQAIKLYFELHSDYQFSEDYLNDFREIVELCQKYGITLKVFISPSHATDREAIYVTGKWDIFENWLRKVVQITPVWDFADYNSITTEPMGDRMKNYADYSHYTKPIGDLILNRILSYHEDKVPADFGVLLTPENIEAHLRKLRQDREVWSQQHPDEVKFVYRMFKEVKKEQSSKKTR
jgi:hypothetical protein